MGLVSTLVALSLATGASAPACELEARVAAVIDWGTSDGVAFDRWVLEDAQSTCGLAPLSLLAPSPHSALFLRGTPWVREGEWVRVTVRAHEEEWVAAVDRGIERSPTPGALVAKPGANVPACLRAEELRWRDDVVRVELDPAGLPGVADAADAWARAARAWSAPACGGASLEAEVGAQGAYPLEADGRSTVSTIREPSLLFAASGLSDGLGLTCYVCDESGLIVESDVRFNGADADWESTCEGEGFDALGVALHEFGHVLGFAHDADPVSVMYAETSVRRLLSRRRLGAVDIDGLCSRYPCASGGCGETLEVDANCPSGAGVCGACADDADCGALTDRCLASPEGPLRCGRACSESFPCPPGLACEASPEGLAQCVPAAPVCVDDRSVREPCADAQACGGAPRSCEEGACRVPCGDGLACPDGGVCVETLDDDGRVLDARCEGGAYREPGGGGEGCGCGVAEATPMRYAWALGLLLLWLRPRSPMRPRPSR